MLKNDTADFFAFTSIFLQSTPSLCGNCLIRGVFLKKGTLLIGRGGWLAECWRGQIAFSFDNKHYLQQDSLQLLSNHQALSCPHWPLVFKLRLGLIVTLMTLRCGDYYIITLLHYYIITARDVWCLWVDRGFAWLYCNLC